MVHQLLRGWSGRAAVVALTFTLVIVGLCLIDGHVDSDHGSAACPALPSVESASIVILLQALGESTSRIALSIAIPLVRALDPPPKFAPIV